MQWGESRSSAPASTDPRKRKGLARGDGRGLKAFRRSGGPKRAAWGRRTAAISAGEYRAGSESGQTRSRQRSHAPDAGQRKRLHPRGMEPDDRAKPKSKVCRWTREEDSPSAGGPNRGRRVRVGPVSPYAGTEGGGFGRASPATGGICILTVWSAILDLTCQLCVHRKEGQEHCRKKCMARGCAF